MYQHLFSKTKIHLTITYVCIIVGICVLFSVLLWRLIDHDFNMMTRQSFARNIRTRDVSRYVLQQERERISSEIKSVVLQRIVLLNVLIAVCGAIGGYFLAQSAIEPIEEMTNNQEQFITDAAHELRTPLAIAQLEIETARAYANDLPSLYNALDISIQQIQNLTKLTQLLLITYKHQKEPKKNVDVRELIHTVEKDVAHIASTKSIIVQSNIPKNIMLDLPETSFRRILMIYIENAVAYSSPKSTIYIDVQKKNSLLTISVRDDGPGIPSKLKKHVFQRLTRGESNVHKGGFGLGLAIARRIADEYGYVLDVQDNSPSGSIFRIIMKTS